MRLPSFDVVAVKAAEVTNTASPAMTATTAAVTKSLRPLLSPAGCCCWICIRCASRPTGPVRYRPSRSPFRPAWASTPRVIGRCGIPLKGDGDALDRGT